ncbi:uncharacterized protein GIQ15_02349 [Arthroderma uncinatum]|uniref:uncharacterized protein n=1 Tax=Arthroderma uncinatum TaxID=74035 RepID=UPI00144A621F|nr:uncharacterized protein GIQ15_02349 [Arthroderma uncinatum]KAF3483025.1 hypothetical protein GIQ15_02349 [Arthroderma uncinatum]
MPAARQTRPKPVQCTVAYRYLSQFLHSSPASPTLPTSPGTAFNSNKAATVTSASCQETSDVPPLTHSPAATVVSADDSPLTPPGNGPADKFTFLQDDMLESKATTLTPSILSADGSFVKQTQQCVDSIARPV